MPPDVGRQLAARRLLRSGQPRRHVGLAIHLLAVEVVAVGVLHVDEDGVVLGGPAPARAAAEVVGPDDLVQEAVAPEDLVEQQLAVVRLAVVDVEVEGALLPEQAVGLLEARREEVEVVLEAVAVARALEQLGAVAAPAEADARGGRVSDGAQRAPLLAPAGVERGVDVDQLEAAVREGGQQIQVLPQEDLVPVGTAGGRLHRPRLGAPPDGRARGLALWGGEQTRLVRLRGDVDDLGCPLHVHQGRRGRRGAARARRLGARHARGGRAARAREARRARSARCAGGSAGSRCTAWWRSPCRSR